MKLRRLVIVISLCMLLPAWSASAARYDLSLGKYFNPQCTGSCPQDYFNSLMTELGLVSGPVFLAPAETLGLNGFSFGLEGSIVPISNDQEFWTLATEGSPGGVIFVPHLHVRKGLPFSVEVGAQLSYVPESELFIVGAEVKWALNEGFYWIPALAVRISMNHMIGSKDFELTNGGWDISVSHPFGIGGMMALTPYAGYNMLFIHASSHVVIPGEIGMDDQVFSEVNWQDNMHHRFFVGCRLTTFIFQVTVEGIFHKDISMFNFKLGFDY